MIWHPSFDFLAFWVYCRVLLKMFLKCFLDNWLCWSRKYMVQNFLLVDVFITFHFFINEKKNSLTCETSSIISDSEFQRWQIIAENPFNSLDLIWSFWALNFCSMVKTFSSGNKIIFYLFAKNRRCRFRHFLTSIFLFSFENKCPECYL